MLSTIRYLIADPNLVFLTCALNVKVYKCVVLNGVGQENDFIPGSGVDNVLIAVTIVAHVSGYLKRS